MDREGFAKFLRRAGKQPNVVTELLAQAAEFEIYEKNERSCSLETAEESDLYAYAAQATANQLRAVMLYYYYTGNTELASQAGELREHMIRKKRKAFRLKDFRGVDPVVIECLAKSGISDVEQMLAAGKTPTLRKLLAEKCGVPEESILELVKLSDISRIGGLKAIRARLYLDAGVDTIEKIAGWEPEALRLMLVDYLARSGFNGIPPLPKEVRSGVGKARKLERIVEY